MRLLHLSISIAMFLIIIPISQLILAYVIPYVVIGDTIRFWPLVAAGTLGLFPPIFCGCYFLVACLQNVDFNEWLKNFYKILLLISYFVGVYTILETIFLWLFPQWQLDMMLLIYPVAIFIVAITPRLMKHFKVWGKSTADQ